MTSVRGAQKRDFDSPGSTPESRSTKKHRQRKNIDTPESYYKVKSILGERIEGGHLQYLVDWEPLNGETFTPTWEPKENCTPVLIESWEQRQNQSQSDSNRENREPSSQNASEGLFTRPEKRKRATIEFPARTLQAQAPFKKPRRAGTAESARFQSVSQENIDYERLPGQIKDSYEEDDQLSSDHQLAQVQVEVGLPDDFDREAYARLISSSQPSQVSQLRLSTQNSEQPASAASPFQNRPTRKPFIWDEDIIPDSQELPDSTSYEPSEPASSKTGPIATQNTQSVSDGDFEATDTRSKQSASSYIESQDTGHFDTQIAEFECHFGDASYTLGQDQHSSYRSQSVIEADSISESEPPTASKELDRIEISPILAAEELVPVSTGGDPQVTTQPSSPEFPASTEEHLVSLVKERREVQLPEESLDLGQLASSREPQGQDHYSSSIPFQTQLPIGYNESEPIQSPSEQFYPRSPPRVHDIPEFSQYAQIVGEDTQTSQLETLPRAHDTQTQNSASGKELSREAPRGISPTSSSSRSSLLLAASSNSQITPGNLPSDSAQKIAETPRVGGSQPLETTERSLVEPTNSSALLPLEGSYHSLSKKEDLRWELSSTRSSLQRASTPTPSPKSSSPPPPAPTTPIIPTSGLTPAFNMEQPISGPSPAKFDAKTKLAEMMAATKAKTAAKQAARAASSISSSPAPSPMLNQNLQAVNANAMLPVFTPIKELTNPRPSQTSPMASPDLDSDSTTLKIVPLGKDEYIIPLPMVSYPRDIYFQTIRNYKSQRLSFLTDEVLEETLVGEIDNMMSELDRLCNHQDLIVEDFSTQRMEPEENQAKWAENVSTKCIFLAEFLPILQPYDKHVVVLVRPGRMIEILECVFKWHGFVYTRADIPEWHGNSQGGPLTVTLVPTGGDVYAVKSASVVIAFDSTAKSVSYLNDFRAQPSSPTTLAPLISLVVTHSVEHLEKCFPTNMEPTERKIKMVSCLSQIAEHFGKLDTDQYPDPPEAARVVAEYVVNGTNGPWPIIDMPEIEGIDLSFTAPQGHDRSSRNAHLAVQPPTSIEIPHSTLKRHPEVMVDVDTPKRQKLSPESRPVEVVPQSSTPNLIAEEISTLGVSDRQQDDQVSSLLKRIANLEIQLRQKEETENALRQINHDLESQRRDYESSMREIQPKYQEALNERGHFEKEITLSLVRETQMRKQRDAKDAELQRLYEQKTLVDSALAAAREALSSTTHPQVAELNSMRDEVDRVNGENEKLKRRLDHMQQELEYMRTQYQNASNAAVESASEAQGVQNLVEELREKADENRVRVHEIQRGNEIAAHLQLIKELRAEKEDLEREVEKKDAELKSMLNGRRATRGTSVPRSPLMGGGAMSPGAARPIGRVMQSSGSRGNSPGPADFNPGRFEAALFQGPTARWGNHLQ